MGVEKSIALVLSGARSSPQVSVHISKFFSAVLMLSVSFPGFLCAAYNDESSANWVSCVFVFVIMVSRSQVAMLKRVGLKELPWGGCRALYGVLWISVISI